jgi:deoxycytidylate deaminase
MGYLIPSIEFPEIIFGLVAPIGTDLSPTLTAIRHRFESEGYKVHDLKVTDVYKILETYITANPPLDSSNTLNRYRTYIAFGDKIRDTLQDSSALAAFSIMRIAQTRLKQKRDASDRFSKCVYVLNQFKRPEEISLLRSVYGRLFFQISIYSKRSVRVDNLAQKFMRDASSGNKDEFISDAEKLVNDDQNESKEKFGQRVSKVFHDADFVINNDIQKRSVDSQFHRFFELLFSSNTQTPTKQEYGMYHAKSAALRTADLSRQVGAAVFSEGGEIIAMGANEVPKANGGTYWSDDEFDDRDFQRNIDSNDERKKEILKEIADVLSVDVEALSSEKRIALEDTTLMDALEYGRIIHAEMSAITDAARRGLSLKNSKLYTTTFPCHMCAKHIVSSGIIEVVFLEPYPKSLAQRLHSDSISVEGTDRGRYSEFPFVSFVHFFGVTPRRFRELFERGKRKDRHGKLQGYIDGTKRPYIEIKSPFYIQLEEIVMIAVRNAVAQYLTDISINVQPA